MSVRHRIQAFQSLPINPPSTSQSTSAPSSPTSSSASPKILTTTSASISTSISISSSSSSSTSTTTTSFSSSTSLTPAAAASSISSCASSSSSSASASSQGSGLTINSKLISSFSATAPTTRVSTPTNNDTNVRVPATANIKNTNNNNKLANNYNHFNKNSTNGTGNNVSKRLSLVMAAAENAEKAMATTSIGKTNSNFETPSSQTQSERAPSPPPKQDKLQSVPWNYLGKIGEKSIVGNNTSGSSHTGPLHLMVGNTSRTGSLESKASSTPMNRKEEGEENGRRNFGFYQSTIAGSPTNLKEQQQLHQQPPQPQQPAIQFTKILETQFKANQQSDSHANSAPHVNSPVSSSAPSSSAPYPTSTITSTFVFPPSQTFSSASASKPAVSLFSPPAHSVASQNLFPSSLPPFGISSFASSSSNALFPPSPSSQTFAAPSSSSSSSSTSPFPTPDLPRCVTLPLTSSPGFPASDSPTSHSPQAPSRPPRPASSLISELVWQAKLQELAARREEEAQRLEEYKRRQLFKRQSQLIRESLQDRKFKETNAYHHHTGNNSNNNITATSPKTGTGNGGQEETTVEDASILHPLSNHPHHHQLSPASSSLSCSPSLGVAEESDDDHHSGYSSGGLMSPSEQLRAHEMMMKAANAGLDSESETQIHHASFPPYSSSATANSSTTSSVSSPTSASTVASSSSSSSSSSSVPSSSASLMTTTTTTPVAAGLTTTQAIDLRAKLQSWVKEEGQVEAAISAIRIETTGERASLVSESRAAAVSETSVTSFVVRSSSVGVDSVVSTTGPGPNPDYLNASNPSRGEYDSDEEYEQGKRKSVSMLHTTPSSELSPTSGPAAFISPRRRTVLGFIRFEMSQI